MVILLFVLQLFDTASTVYWIHAGKAYEWNPAMAWVMDTFGLAGFSIMKVVLAMLSCYMLWVLKDIRVNKYVVTAAVVLYGLLAAWHVFMGSILIWRGEA